MACSRTLSAEWGGKFQPPAPVPPFKNFGSGSIHSTLLVLGVPAPQTCLQLSWSICIKIIFLTKYEEMDSCSLEANVHTARIFVKYWSTFISDFFYFRCDCSSWFEHPPCGSEHLFHQEKLAVTQHSLRNCVDHLAVLSHIGYTIRCKFILAIRHYPPVKVQRPDNFAFFQCPGVFALAMVVFSSLNC